MFRYGTVNSNLSVNLLDTNLGIFMRAMHGFDISVMGISQKNAKPGAVLTDAKGMVERGIAGLKYMTLWAFMPKGRSTGGDTSLVWDARILHRNAYTSSSGRLAAVTLCGPKQSHLRVISVYAPVNPEVEPDVVRQLYKDLLNQMSFALRNSVPVMVLGDFNDVPVGDAAFAKRDKFSILLVVPAGSWPGEVCPHVSRRSLLDAPLQCVATSMGAYFQPAAA
jgi:hypothetical protein